MPARASALVLQLCSRSPSWPRRLISELRCSSSPAHTARCSLACCSSAVRCATAASSSLRSVTSKNSPLTDSGRPASSQTMWLRSWIHTEVPCADLTRYSRTYALLVLSAWMNACLAGWRSSSTMRSVHRSPCRPNDPARWPTIVSTLLSKNSTLPSRYPLNMTAGTLSMTSRRSRSAVCRLRSRSLRSVMSKNRPVMHSIAPSFRQAIRLLSCTQTSFPALDEIRYSRVYARLPLRAATSARFAESRSAGRMRSVHLIARDSNSSLA